MKANNSRQYSIALYGPLLALVLLFGACAPDLIVKNVHIETWLGSARLMKGTVENQGNGTAGESKISLEHRTNLNDPFVLKGKMPVPSLGPGESKEVPLMPVVPPTPACLQVRVCADADNEVNESSESNNCITKSWPTVCP